MEAVEPAQTAAENPPQAVPIPMMSEEEKKEAWKKFESIVYKNLEKILERRPAYPVTKFAKAILEDVDLDENGDPILKKKKKKDKKDKDKKKKDKDKKDKDKKDKDKKKKGGDSAEEAKDDDEPKKKDKKKKSAAESDD